MTIIKIVFELLNNKYFHYDDQKINVDTNHITMEIKGEDLFDIGEEFKKLHKSLNFKTELKIDRIDIK